MPNQATYDGTFDFLGGQDASKNPDSIAKNAYAAGVNVSCIRGDLTPRWGFEKKELTFQDGVLYQQNLYTKSYEEVFRTGKYQFSGRYTIGTTEFIVIVISGVIYLIDSNTFEVQVLTIADGSTLNPYANRLNGTVAGRFFVIFDWPAYPVIIDGLEARRADPDDNEVPISVLGAYNQNRLFVANAGNEFTGGDPAGSLATPDAPITFNEVLTPASNYFGQIFQLPTEYFNLPITAMAFMQVVDTSTGIGPLLISTRNQVFSFLTQQPRSAWENGQFGSLFVQSSGFAGPRSFASVNSDIFYLGYDGQVRTISMSREEQRRWAKIPLSKEVENWLIFNDRELIEFSAVEYFQNKVFITANPVRTKCLDLDNNSINDFAFGGMVVLELDNLSNFGTPGNPAWAGLWTGVRPMDFLTLGDRMFIMSKDFYRVNNLYEVTPNRTYDLIDGKIRQVKSQIYFREHDFETPLNNKEVRNIDVALEDVKGDFNLSVYFKPSQSPNFLFWRDFCHKAPWRNCGNVNDTQFNGYQGHSFKDLNLGSPADEDACNPVTQDLYQNFRRLQVKMEISGIYWRLHSYRILAMLRQENQTESVCTFNNVCGEQECPFEAIALGAECTSFWEIPEITSCQSMKT